MHRQYLARWSVVALLTVAGAGWSAIAQPPSDMDQPRPKDRMGDPNDPMADRGPMHFCSGKKLHGMNIKNAEDKTVGEINDMIIDRGSGKIQYLVVKSGAVLGLGGKLVTVPYRNFGWDANDKHAMLNATTEELKTWPEFDKKRWAEGTRGADSYVRIIGKDYYDTTNSPWPVEMQSDRSITPIKGTVKTFRRQDVGNGREEIIVVVSTPDKTEREVVLGPSWYTAGNNSIAFYRDAPVEMDVYQYDRQGRTLYLARSAKVNGKDIGYYSPKGQAYWTGSVVSDRDAFGIAPFLLFTEVKGKNVDCRGEKCGDVEDVVVECNNGRVLFLIVDPDKAALGIGDEDRLVPWTIMTTSTDGKIHLDASKSMISSAPTEPKDLKTLADDNLYRRIYSIYDTTPVSYGGSRR